MSSSFLTYDLESNGLYEQATKIHCICPRLNNREYVFTDDCWPDKDGSLTDFFDLIPQADAIVCHNQIWYDLPMLSKHLGLEYSIKWGQHTINGHKLEIIDTLVDSRWLWPDRPLPVMGLNKAQAKRIGSHGLEAWSYRVSGTKPYIDDWSTKPIGEYINRCQEDVRNNEKVFYALMDEMQEYFGGQTWEQTRDNARTVLNIEHLYSHLFFVQGQRGVKFDIEGAKRLVATMDAESQALAAEIEPQLPPVAMPLARLKAYSFPAKLYKKDGSTTSHFDNFLEKHGAKLVGKDIEYKGQLLSEPFPQYLETHEPLLLSNTAGIKQYFLDRGWQPTMYNVKRDERGKPIRDMFKQVINTTPMMRDRMGNICPNLVEMDDEMIRKILRYDAVCRRRSVIESSKNEEKGWLNHPRLAIDGRLPAEANTCGANTGRVTHRVVANVPRPTSPVYGKETRALFTVDPEYYLLGYDASGLEGRTIAHETSLYDGGIFAKLLLEGDVHSSNAEMWDIWTTKDGKQVLDRNRAKTTFYALLYGAMLARFAATIKKPKDEAERDFEAFWQARPSVRAAIDGVVEEWLSNNKKFIRAIDGRPIHVRAEHSAFNARAQSMGAIIMKMSRCIMSGWMTKLYPDCHQVIDYHDECFSYDTEVLTPDGWVQLGRLDSDATALQYTSTGEVEFVKIERKISKYYEGNMYTLADPRFYSQCTEKHRRVFKDGKGRLTIKEAKDGFFTNYKIPRGGVKKAGVILDSSLAYLITCLQADGRYNDDAWGITVKKDRKVQKLRQLKKDLNLNLTEAKPDNRDRIHFRLCKGESRRLCIDKYLTHEKDKNFTTELFNLDKTSTEAFIDALRFWDGSIEFNRGVYCTTNRNNAEIAQTLWHLCGKSSSIVTSVDNRKETYKDYYRVYFNVKATTCARKKDKVEPYSGQVYCITVPSGMFLVRQRGCIYVTGNCQWEVPRKYVKWFKIQDEAEGLKLQKEKFHSKPVKIGNQWWSSYCHQGKLGVQSVTKAGQFFKLNVPLTGEYLLGRNWAETH